MEWFKKKMRVFLFVCLLFPFYSYATKKSLPHNYQRFLCL